MKNLKKKGFTIVELVIVIAVIAVLAAVLIPTFVSLTKKANLSADQVAVRNMNTVLATAENESKDFGKLINTLSDNGYNSKKALIPTSKDHVFYWYSTYNTIILVDEKDNVVFPADEELIDGYNKDKGTDVIFDLGNSSAGSEDDLNAAIAHGGEVYLMEDITLSGLLTFSSDNEVTINLNGHTIKRENGQAIYINNDSAVVNIYGEGEIVSVNYATTFISKGTLNIYGGKLVGKTEAAFSAGGTINIYGGEFYSTIKAGETYIDGKGESVYITKVDQNETSGYGATLNVLGEATGKGVINVYVDNNGIPYGKFYNASGENGAFQEYDYSKQVSYGEVQEITK